MISIHHHHCQDRGKKRIRFKLEYAGIIGVVVWFGLAYWLFHRVS